MKIYLIKRRTDTAAQYRGTGCYTSSIVDAILYNNPVDAFVAIKELKQGLDIDNKQPNVFVSELTITEKEVTLDVVPVRHRGCITA